jgi:hypothetical protein
LPIFFFLGIMTSNASKDLAEFKTKDGVKFGKELEKDFLFEEGWRNLNHGMSIAFSSKVRNKMRMESSVN